MSIREHLIEQFAQETEIHFLEGNEFDNAIIGFEEKHNAVVYSFKLIIGVLMKDGMTEEEAVEYYWYNIDGIRGNINIIVVMDNVMDEL